MLRRGFVAVDDFINPQPVACDKWPPPESLTATIREPSLASSKPRRLAGMAKPCMATVVFSGFQSVAAARVGLTHDRTTGTGCITAPRLPP